MPADSLIIDEQYDYCDVFSEEFSDPGQKTKIEDLISFRNSPAWISFLMSCRDGIVRIFGLKTPDKGSRLISERITLRKGLRLGIFKVSNFNGREVIMSDQDKHLNFHLSVYLQHNEGLRSKVIATTMVSFNNFFGRIYFFLVKPFHRLIVPSLLKSAIKSLNLAEK